MVYTDFCSKTCSLFEAY